MNKIHALIITLFNAHASTAKNADKVRLEACEALAGGVKELGGEIAAIIARADEPAGKWSKITRAEIAGLKADRTLLVLALNQIIGKLTGGQAKNVEQRLGGTFTKLSIKPNGDYSVAFTAGK